MHFENNYVDFEPWLSRLIDEHNQLDAALSALRKFRNSEGIKRIDGIQAQLMHQQERHMSHYLDILNTRILRGLTQFSAGQEQDRRSTL